MKCNSNLSGLLRFILSCWALAAVAGCGPSKPPMAPVKGKVTLNGQPLKTGSILTVPEAGKGAYALIGPDGYFELGTYAKTDGALVGTHKVAVVAAAENKGRKGPEGSGTKLLVPDRYVNVEMSQLTIEVKPGETNTPTLELTSP